MSAATGPADCRRFPRRVPCARHGGDPSFGDSVRLGTSRHPRADEHLPTMIASLLTLLIRVYQLTLSKVIFALAGPVCRFEPSCSRYAVACIQSHGALRGSLLSLRRLSKCHPFHAGGFDPPPPPRRRATPSGAAGGSAKADAAGLAASAAPGHRGG